MQDGNAIFDTSGMQELFFEDIRDLSIHNGVFRCTLYSFRIIPGFAGPVWVPILPLAMPVPCVAPVAGKALEMVGSEAIRAAKDFMRAKLASPLAH